MGDHVAVVTGTPTQVAHSGKTVLRTLTQVVIPLLVLLAALIPLVIEYLGPYLPETWVAWLAGAVGFLLALTALVTKVMALPALQPFLAKLGLGTGVEKEALAVPDETITVEGVDDDLTE